MPVIIGMRASVQRVRVRDLEDGEMEQEMKILLKFRLPVFLNLKSRYCYKKISK